MKRDHAIDNLKLFAIVLIIVGHSGMRRLYPNFDLWLFSFHVPIFFFISGYLLEKKSKFVLDIKQMARNYLVPYICFSAIYRIVVDVLNIIAGNRGVIESLKLSFVTITSFDGGDSANWFLATLFLGEVLYIIERKNLQHKSIIALNMLLLTVPILIPHENEYIRGLLRTFPALFFLTCGGVFYKKEKILFHFFDKRILLVPFGIVLNTVVCMYNGRVDTYGLQFGRFPILYYVDAIVISSILFYVFSRCIRCEITLLTWYGRNTLIVMATHQALIEIIYVLDSHIFGIVEKYGGALIYLTGVVLLAEIPVIIIINRMGYWMLGKRERVTK